MDLESLVLNATRANPSASYDGVEEILSRSGHKVSSRKIRDVWTSLEISKKPRRVRFFDPRFSSASEIGDVLAFKIYPVGGNGIYESFYLHLAVDVASGLAFARFLKTKSAEENLVFLAAGAFSIVEEMGFRVKSVFTDKGHELSGRLETHQFEQMLLANDISHLYEDQSGVLAKHFTDEVFRAIKKHVLFEMIKFGEPYPHDQLGQELTEFVVDYNESKFKQYMEVMGKQYRQTRVRLNVSGASPVGVGHLSGNRPIGLWKFTRKEGDSQIWQQGRYSPTGKKHGWWSVFSSSGQLVVNIKYNNGHFEKIIRHVQLTASDYGEINITDLFFIPGFEVQKL